MTGLNILKETCDIRKHFINKELLCKRGSWIDRDNRCVMSFNNNYAHFCTPCRNVLRAPGYNGYYNAFCTNVNCGNYMVCPSCINF